jgi:uncharacterized damage-inducible protein DinB
MNSIMREYWSVFQMYQALRNQLMDACSDEDLAFSPGGDNPSLGKLCLEIGEVEHAYVESFQTFGQDFSYRNEDPGLAGSVDRLSAWFGELDGELQAAIEALTDDDLLHRTIDRGGGFVIPPRIQLEIYKEALLIFYGKVSVYLKAMGKPRTEQWQDWIA